jgi:peptidoglycan hydrolase CwlO-like protein
MKNVFLAKILVLCIVVFSVEVEARKGLSSLYTLGRGAKAVNGIKEYSYGTLTVQKLRACLRLEKKLDSSSADLSNDQILIENQEQHLNNLEGNLSALKANLDVNKNAVFYTQNQVDNFNLEVESYNQLTHEYNGALQHYKNFESSYNKTIEKHNDLVHEFQVSCEGRRYYEDDLVSANMGSTPHCVEP